MAQPRADIGEFDGRFQTWLRGRKEKLQEHDCWIFLGFYSETSVSRSCGNVLHMVGQEYRTIMEADAQGDLQAGLLTYGPLAYCLTIGFGGILIAALGEGMTFANSRGTGRIFRRSIIPSRSCCM